ncbi:tripartite tricarboxylate transporter TctB family protein [Paracoccus sp. P2]|uniref:tripartite tricarboxylate transporter TctB family protein n=1 Tax=Paracoccus sp. P2 TaxID=3248840 RepID=UPI00391F9BDC
MVVRDQKNFVAGLLYLALGVIVAVCSIRYELGTAVRMGPGYFPFVLGVVLSLTGICVVIGALAPGAPLTQIGGWPLRNLVILTVAVVLFGVVLEPLGLIVAIPVLLGTASLANPQFSLRALLISVGFLVLLSWIVFIKLLGLQIPLLGSAFAN